MTDADVIVVGAGGAGPVVAHSVAEAGLRVMMVEAGPWLDPDVDYTALEDDMGSMVHGQLRWGPADRAMPPWRRRRKGVGLILQAAGVGGTTRHYNGLSARAYRAAHTLDWPLAYDELVPYYEQVEAFLPVHRVAALAPKDALFASSCAALGLPREDGKDVGRASWGHCYNAILPVRHDAGGVPTEGCTWCGHCLIGCSRPGAAPLAGKAKRATNVSYVPAALDTGRCQIVPDGFVTKILTDAPSSAPTARGVRWRSTTTGERHEATARVVVLAGGSIESPRLWLNSELPNPAGTVGRYLTTHYQDFVTGFFERDVRPDIGQVTMAKADFPGYGSFWSEGVGPWGFAVALTAAGDGHWNDDTGTEPWDMAGRAWGERALATVHRYRQALTVAISTDDEPVPENRVELASSWPRDEHGFAPSVSYRPSQTTVARRLWLARTAAKALRAVGAHTIHRTAPRRALMAHIMGTMRMGADPATSVVDAAGEAHHVRRLFVADSSVLPTGLGGVPPTLTTQALATRAATLMLSRHFG
jgi:choline dehydrogenase-like flavoprotein